MNKTIPIHEKLILLTFIAVLTLLSSITYFSQSPNLDLSTKETIENEIPKKIKQKKIRKPRKKKGVSNAKLQEVNSPDT